MTHTSGLSRIIFENVAETLGIGALPESEQNAIIDRLERILEERVFQKIVEHIEQTHHREALFAVLKDEQSSIEIKYAYLRNHIPNLIEFIDTEVAAFKQEIASA